MGQKPCRGFGIKVSSSLQTSWSVSIASPRSAPNPPPEEINSLAMDGMAEAEKEEGGEAAVAMATAEVGSSVAAKPNEKEY